MNKDRTLSGTLHNVLGIKVGVGITLAIRELGHREDAPSLYHHRVPSVDENTEACMAGGSRRHISTTLADFASSQVLEPETAREFSALVPLGTKEAEAPKQETEGNAQAIFRSHTVGVLAARDDGTYDFHRDTLVVRMRKFVGDFNDEVDRYRRV